MKIAVCFKILPNPDRVLEEDWEQFSLSADLSYAGMDFNCFDQSALELGLQMKEQMAVQGAEVSCTALTVSASVPPSLAAGLYAAGYDRVVCLTEKNREFDPGRIAGLLAEEIEEEGAELVLTGASAGMAETGMVPYCLARRLGLPHVARVEGLSWEEGLACARCREEAGFTERKAPLPLLCTVGNSPEVLRCATLRARMRCMSRTAEQKALSGPERELLPEPRLTRPQTGRRCTRLEGEPGQLAEQLLPLLRETAGNGSASAERKSDSVDKKLLCSLSRRVKLFGNYGINAENLIEFPENKQTELLVLPDTHGGRRLALELSERRGVPCFFGGELTGLTERCATVKKGACAANLEWMEELPLPAVLTVPAHEWSRYDGVPTLELPEGETPGWLKSERLLEPAERGGLQTARLAVICGCGIKTRAAADRARLLAEKLGAGFGLTRPAALNGWGSTAEIVGQSGLRIAPACALVLGAAGAGAFAVGIEKAGRIIAVNKDPDALIFGRADYGAETDAETLVEQLLEKLS